MRAKKRTVVKKTLYKIVTNRNGHNSAGSYSIMLNGEHHYFDYDWYKTKHAIYPENWAVGIKVVVSANTTFEDSGISIEWDVKK